MQILITGASGLLGSALVPALNARGHRVIKLNRTPDASGSQPAWDPARGTIALAPAGRLDAVIHLAGASIAQRWTTAAKRRIRESRVDATRLLSDALVQLPQPPAILICASAIGIYGERGDRWLDENSPPGQGFLADLTRDWEAAAAPAIAGGWRVIHLRLGIVLAAQGGALAKMVPPFRLGLGGPLGDGGHYWSWIAIEDVVAVIHHLLGHDSLSGPVNAVALEPVTNRKFTKTLGTVLRRPTFFTVPRFMVNCLFGEMGREALLGSLRVRPAKLVASGFTFRFPTLEPALRHILA